MADFFKQFFKVLNTFTLVVLIACIAILIFGLDSCYNANPSDIGTWYLDYIYEEDKKYSAGSQDYYKGKLLSTDYFVFKFEEHNVITITDIDGNVQTGKYTAKRSFMNRTTKVTINLYNGKTLTGSCSKYTFDGTWYYFSLDDGGIIYGLTNSNSSPKGSQNGVILKEEYPEIAQLSTSDIQEIYYEISADDNEKYTFVLLEESDKEKFLNSFSTASFLARRYYYTEGYNLNRTNYNPAILKIKTDTYESSISLYVSKEFSNVYILYNSHYYRLRDDFAEWLLSFGNPEDKTTENVN